MTLSAAVLFAFTATPLSAAGDKPATPPAAPAEKKAPAADTTYPLRGQVVSVTETLLTIKGGEGKKDRTYDMTKETKIVNGDAPAALADVKPGLTVGGLLSKSAQGNDKVVKINVGVKQKGAPKGEAKPAEPPPATKGN